MSEIPEDIIDVAEMTWAALEDADGIRECVLTIAIALNAARQTERERCAKIAVSASEHLTACLERSRYSDHDTAVFESAISAANAIAVTIRTPTKQ